MHQLKCLIFTEEIIVNPEYRLREWDRSELIKHQDPFGIPVRLKAEAGFVREWCSRIAGLHTAICLRPAGEDETPHTINGVMLAIYNDHRWVHDKRYGHVEQIPSEYFEPLGWQSLPPEAEIYIFHPKNKGIPNIEYPILQSFIDTCLKGFLDYGEDFAIEFLQTVQGWSKFWVNDRKLPRRPWIHEKDYKLLDELLEKYPTEGNTFHERKMETEYAEYFVQRAMNVLPPENRNISQNIPHFSKKLESQNHHFIFGFGSLINALSRYQTNPKSKDAIPVRIAAEFGYVRAWNFHGTSSRLTALGVRKTKEGEKGQSINGVVYPVDGNDMEKCDEREEGYVRISVPWELVSCLSWEALPNCNETFLWMYVPERSQGPSVEYPILQSYIDVCINGCLAYGEDYAIEFLETSFDWNHYWVNDRLVARRPWIHCPNYQAIDDLLALFPMEGNVFYDRKLAVEYAIHYVQENEQ